MTIGWFNPGALRRSTNGLVVYLWLSGHFSHSVIQGDMRPQIFDNFCENTGISLIKTRQDDVAQGCHDSLALIQQHVCKQSHDMT